MHCASPVASWAGVSGLPLTPLLPLRLCPIPGPLYTVLMGYKESPVAEARPRYATMPARLLREFLAAHAGCVAAVAGGPLGVALCVPSTARPDGAPLTTLVGMAEAAEAVGACWSPDLLRRARRSGRAYAARRRRLLRLGGGASATGRRTRAAARRHLRQRARSQSAAAALRLAGAAAVVVVALGRVLRPDRAPSHAAFLRAHRRARPEERSEGSPCCRCTQAGTPSV